MTRPSATTIRSPSPLGSARSPPAPAGSQERDGRGSASSRAIRSGTVTVQTMAPARVRRARPFLVLLAAGASIVALRSFGLDPLTGHFGAPFEDFAAYLAPARWMAGRRPPPVHLPSAPATPP